jgi:hypothetical protein
MNHKGTPKKDSKTVDTYTQVGLKDKDFLFLQFNYSAEI